MHSHESILLNLLFSSIVKERRERSTLAGYLRKGPSTSVMKLSQVAPGQLKLEGFQ